jgi:uncharacterized protein YjiS (DUF1127 family)
MLIVKISRLNDDFRAGIRGGDSEKERIMSAQFSPLPSALRLPARFAAPKVGLVWLTHLARFWRAYDTRRQLNELDAHLLRDIGVTRLDARLEAARKPWDIQGG